MNKAQTIPAGFRALRKIGIIPNDWDVVRLDQIAKVNTATLSETTPVDYEFTYVDLGSVDNGRIDLPRHKIKFGEAPSRARRSANKGDIVMATVRPYLHGFARLEFEPEDMVFSTGFAIIAPNELNDAEFIYQTLYSTTVARQLYGCLVGTNYPAINASDVAGLRIVFPRSSHERRIIAAVLSSWDKAIYHNDSLIEKKQLLKKGLTRQLLTCERRFPGFTGNWVTCKIGDVLTAVNRFVTLDDDTEYRLVSIRRRSGGLFDRETRRGRDIGYHRLKTIKSGDFAIARRQVIHGAMAMVPEHFDGAFVSDSYATLVPRKGATLDVSFFNFLSQMPLMYHKAFRCSYGVAAEKMFFNLKWFLDEEITIPPTRDEQKTISSALETLDRDVSLLQTRAEALKKEKRGLMQKLLTGQLPVKEIDNASR